MSKKSYSEIKQDVAYYGTIVKSYEQELAYFSMAIQNYERELETDLSESAIEDVTNVLNRMYSDMAKVEDNYFDACADYWIAQAELFQEERKDN